MKCECRKGGKCSGCIERDGLTKPKALVPPVFSCLIDESAGMRDEQ